MIFENVLFRLVIFQVSSVIDQLMTLSKHQFNVYSRKTTESILVVDHWVGVPGKY